jgi:hypothetical protein
MKLMDRHENVIAILDIIMPPSYAQFTEVYLVQVSRDTLSGYQADTLGTHGNRSVS